MALHIVSQRISTIAALTIFARLGTRMETGGHAAAILRTDPEALREAGLSAAKVRSLQDLAERVLDGRLSFARLAASRDETATTELTRVRGVGLWTAQMFLLHHLRRPDVFPSADVGLQRAARAAWELGDRPTPAELEARADEWRPYRSYAAALLWASGADAVAAEHGPARGSGQRLRATAGPHTGSFGRTAASTVGSDRD